MKPMPYNYDNFLKLQAEVKELESILLKVTASAVAEKPKGKKAK